MNHALRLGERRDARRAVHPPQTPRCRASAAGSAASAAAAPSRTTTPFSSTTSGRCARAPRGNRGRRSAWRCRCRGSSRRRARSRATISGARPSVASSRISSSRIGHQRAPIASICCSPPDSCWPPWPRRSARRGKVSSTRSSVQSRRPSRPGARRHHQIFAHASGSGRCRALRARTRCRGARCVRRGPRACRGRARGPCRARPHVAHQRADQRGLAHAVAAQQADRLAARDARSRRAARGSRRSTRAGRVPR